MSKIPKIPVQIDRRKELEIGTPSTRLVGIRRVLSSYFETHTVAWTDYRFYRSKLFFFFPEALTRKSKTIAYIEHIKYRI